MITLIILFWVLTRLNAPAMIWGAYWVSVVIWMICAGIKAATSIKKFVDSSLK